MDPHGPPEVASVTCVYPPIHIKSTVTLEGSRSAHHVKTDDFAEIMLFVCFLE